MRGKKRKNLGKKGGEGDSKILEKRRKYYL